MKSSEPPGSKFRAAETDMVLSKLWDKLRLRWPEMRSSVLQDLGTFSIGTAAILLTRAFPSSSSEEFSAGMVYASVAFAVAGIFLRVIAKF